MGNVTILSFTGGLDSTFLAHTILSRTDDDLKLFWMDFTQLEWPESAQWYRKMIAAEKIVTPRVAKWLSENVRPVTFEIVPDVKYLPEPQDYPATLSRQWRSLPMLQTAIAIMKRDGLACRFVYGRAAENTRGRHRAVVDQWFQTWWKANAPAGATFEEPLIKLWHGRPHALQALPPKLLALVLTCNNPDLANNVPVNCGQCEKCRLTATSQRMLARGKTADAILDYLLRERCAGRYVNRAVEDGDPALGAHAPSPKPTYSEGSQK